MMLAVEDGAVWELPTACFLARFLRQLFTTAVVMSSVSASGVFGNKFF